MEVFECPVCGDAIANNDPKGIAVIMRADDPRRRPVWGARMVLET